MGVGGTGSRLENSGAVSCHLSPAPRPRPPAWGPAWGPSSQRPLSRACAEPSAPPARGARRRVGRKGAWKEAPLGLAAPRPREAVEETGSGQSITQCWTVGQNVAGRGGQGADITAFALRSWPPPGRRTPAHPHPFRFLCLSKYKISKEGHQHSTGHLPKAHLNCISLKLHNNPRRWDSLSHFTAEKTSSERARHLPQVTVSGRTGI